MEVICPFCSIKGNFNFPNENKNTISLKLKVLERNSHKVFFDKSESFITKMIGVFLFSIGIFLFSYPLGVDNKIGLTFVFIGIFFILFFPKERTHLNIEFYLFFFLIGWLLIMTVLTNGLDFDTFFFSIVLGLLIVKEFANGYLTESLKKKLSILTLVFFSLSMILVAEKVISFFSM